MTITFSTLFHSITRFQAIALITFVGGIDIGIGVSSLDRWLYDIVLIKLTYLGLAVRRLFHANIWNLRLLSIASTEHFYFYVVA